MTRRRVKNHKRTGAFLKIGLCLYLGFCVFGIVWMRAAVVNMEYELGDLDRLRSDLATERTIISAQRANTYSTEKIEKVALRKLKMRLPDREKVYFVKKTSTAGPFRTSMKER